MKKLVFLLVASIASFMTIAQTELGLAGGFSVNSKPTNNMYYKGDKLAINYAGVATVLFNMKNNLQGGIQLNIQELSRNSEMTFVAMNGVDVIGNDGKKFVYSKVSSTLCGVLNRKWIVDSSGSYIYYGAAMGFAIARNNSKKLESNVSYKAPDGGFGLAAGLQVGYARSLSDKLSLNLEIAARYMDLDYSAKAPIFSPSSNLHYRIITYPVTLGLRYKIWKD
jgi:hypothetical protein